MDRRTIDEDLDDLTLDADLDTPGDEDNAPTGVMAPPPKRSSARKTPVRKPASGSSGNGRVESNGSTKLTDRNDAASDSAPAETNPDGKNATVQNPAEKNPVGKSADQENTVVVPAAPVVADSVAENAPSDSTSSSSDSTSSDTAVIDTPTTEIAKTDIVEAAKDSPAAAEGSTDSTPTEVVSSSSPAMPADDIWTPRSGRSGSGTTSSWTTAEVSDRPRGNAFEMDDAFSAPPMPSEPVTSRSSSFSSFSSTSPSAVKQSAGSRPSGTADPDPATKTASPSAAQATRAAGQRTGIPRPKATVRRPSARQAHLTIARVEPWSVMKFSFAVSVIAFVVLFVAVAVLYGVLSALGVFDSLQHLVTSVTSSQTSAGYNVRQWFSASRVLGYTALLGCLNIVLITAMSTIGAVIYNLTSRLIGGVEVTLRETD